jgi:hypothetical protein
MPTLVNSIEIEAPADEVFDYASDLTNELEWGSAVVRVERIGEGPIGVGSKFLAEWKGSGPVEIEYVRFERPRHWTALGRNARIDTNLSGEVVALGADRCRFTAGMEIVPHGFFRLLTPLLLRAMQKTERKNLAALKSTIERKQGASVVR